MRSTRRKKQTAPQSGIFLRILKAALFGCVLTVIAILAFALLLKWELFGEGSISVVTSIIKALCAGFAGFITARGCQQKPWLWAGVSGAFYVLLAFLAFALVEKTMALNFGLVADMLMGFIAGVAGGMLLQLGKT